MESSRFTPTSVITSGLVEPIHALEVLFDQVGAAVAGAVAPARDGLLVEHAVAERHDAHPAGLQHAVHLGEHLLGPLQVLHGDVAQHGVELLVLRGEAGGLVEVAHEEAAEAAVAPQLLGVHAVPHHLRVLRLRRQVAHPAAAHVQHLAPLRHALPVQLRELPDERVVHVVDHARRGVEVVVVDGVHLLAAGRSNTSRRTLPPSEESDAIVKTRARRVERDDAATPRGPLAAAAAVVVVEGARETGWQRAACVESVWVTQQAMGMGGGRSGSWGAQVMTMTLAVLVFFV
eukprot:CAMPEP_0197592306 /NCGR_PEP_ID=MMETSP1326-20131121/15020_1 /TAXON_ID=1155430 /ORGANISM="Genus nov. species nov., Strain RCC2288" /LENGTH=288 /DNA_ID=CAMNT_0043157991 /DNA_START=183 /DNA_END=1049 /DNA_ORIENTATION=+